MIQLVDDTLDIPYTISVTVFKASGIYLVYYGSVPPIMLRAIHTLTLKRLCQPHGILLA
jgi:hypothetical protein